MDELEWKVGEILREKLKYAVCSTCEHVSHFGGDNCCDKCVGPTQLFWKLDDETVDSIANKIVKACKEANEKEKPKTTFGQILDLMDKDRESEEEVRLMNGTEVSLCGPMNSPFWKPFEDRTVNNLAIEDGALEVWFEED